MANETFITKRITNQDVYDELLAQRKIKEDILAQAKLTNGRVTKLEKRSIGNWVSNHPYKFAGFVIVFLATVISDIRHPLIAFIMKLWL